MAVKICPACGGKVSESRQDCIHCGFNFSLSKKCPDCEEIIDISKKECPSCGYIFQEENSLKVQVSNIVDFETELEKGIEPSCKAEKHKKKISKRERSKVVNARKYYKTNFALSLFSVLCLIIGLIVSTFYGYEVNKNGFLTKFIKLAYQGRIYNLLMVVSSYLLLFCSAINLYLNATKSKKILNVRVNDILLFILNIVAVVFTMISLNNRDWCERWVLITHGVAVSISCLLTIIQLLNRVIVKKYKELSEESGNKERRSNFVAGFTSALIVVAMLAVTVMNGFLTSEGAICKIASDENGNKYAVFMGYYGENSSVVIPSEYKGYKVKEIDTGAFCWCKAITNVTIPDTVTSIGDYAFYYCESLTNITIPNGVTNVGSYAFYHCEELTSIVIPKGVTIIKNNAFNSCYSLKSIILPEGITTIEFDGFDSCRSLTSITIPDGVRSIGAYAFSNCTSLKSIILPESVETLGSWIILGSTNVAIYCKSENYISWGSEWYNYGNPNIVYWHRAEKPSTDGSYWHYDEMGNPIIWENKNNP